MIESHPEPVTWAQIHWRGNDLLDVPPVLLVTELAVLQFRQAMARYIDGRYSNDVLYRAVLAIRREFNLEPHPYVVAFPFVALEIPIDIRAIADEPDQLVGLVKMPRGIREPAFDVDDLDEALANHVRVSQRSKSVQLLKSITEDGSEIGLNDSCEADGSFRHVFRDGTYEHSYRYVASMIPELENLDPDPAQ